MLCKLPWMVRDVGTLVAKRLVTLTWIPKTLCTQTSLCPFLHTFLYTFLKVLEKNVFLTIKSFFSWWSFPLFSWPQCLIQGWYCKEIYFLFFKLDSLHFSVYLNPSFERFFFSWKTSSANKWNPTLIDRTQEQLKCNSALCALCALIHRAELLKAGFR